MPLRTLIVVLAAIVAFATQAQQYRWLDQKGHVQYTDTPPPPYAKGVEKKSLRSGAAPDGQEPFALQTARRNSPVKLYSSPDCGPACDDARNLLNHRGIPFSEVSVTQVAQIEELKKVSGSGVVPVILVGSAVQKGFDPESYHRALDAAGYPKTASTQASGQTPPPKPPAPAAPALAAPLPETPTRLQSRKKTADPSQRIAHQRVLRSSG